MTKVEEPNKVGDISSGKNTAEITLGDKKYIIHKLKAGKFYDALKVYMDMIREVTPKSATPGKETELDLDKVMNSMFGSWPTGMVKFISICCEGVDVKEPLTEEKIKKIAYPEEITKTFGICLKLNKVTENLKNFAAPMGELGAVKAK